MTIKEQRLTAIARELNNAQNPGAMGRAFELSCARAGSRKTCVSKQGKVDVSVKVVVNGKEVFNAIVKPDLKAMLESCAEFYDPERLFPASVDVVIE